MSGETSCAAYFVFVRRHRTLRGLLCKQTYMPNTARPPVFGFFGGFGLGGGAEGRKTPYLPTLGGACQHRGNPYLPTPATLTYHKRKVSRRFGDPLTFSLPGSGVRLALGRLGGRFGDRLGAWLSVRACVRNGDPN